MRVKKAIILSILVIMLALLAGFASAQTIHVSEASIMDKMDCARSAGVWHFVINQIYTGDAPESIIVTWEGGVSETVELDSFTATTAHYSTTLHTNLDLVDATAVIYNQWSGNFVLSCEPTAVTLIGFSAEWVSKKKGARIEWETVSETDCLGFNVLRSNSRGTRWRQINKEIIPSEGPGSMFGAEYKFWDTSIKKYRPYKYILQEIDTSGEITEYGPITLDR